MKFHAVLLDRARVPFSTLDRMSLWSIASVLPVLVMVCWESQAALHHQPSHNPKLHQHQHLQPPLLMEELIRRGESEYGLGDEILIYYRPDGEIM